MAQSELHKKFRVALDSRRERAILRRPHPDAFIPLPQSQSHIQLQPGAAPLVDFSSNDYLSLATHKPLRKHFLTALQRAPQILGSGGSRLLDGTSTAHFELEARLAKFFSSPSFSPSFPSSSPESLTALLFNSGFDANAALFSVLPQPGDTILYDALVHASVHDGMRASRVPSSRRIPFKHNCVKDLALKVREALSYMDAEGEGGNRKSNGKGTIFVAFEALYSMDGDFAPLSSICSTIEALVPPSRACIIVDEAHSTGIYGRGRGMVEELGLGARVHIRLHTFGKAMASSGAVVICDALTREYLINYARSFIFTTAQTVASVIAVGCSFDMIEDGTTARLANHLFEISTRFTTTLRNRLVHIPPRIMALPPHLLPDTWQSNKGLILADPALSATILDPTFPTPIVPILTPLPRPLAQHLHRKGFLARPITHPTVPKGEERVRICLHAANTTEEVDGLVDALVEWATEQSKNGNWSEQKGTLSLPSAKL